jgi:hypothetical protein
MVRQSGKTAIPSTVGVDILTEIQKSTGIDWIQRWIQTKKRPISEPFTFGRNLLSLLIIGATRFELAASWSQTRRSTKLSYAPQRLQMGHCCNFE